MKKSIKGLTSNEVTIRIENNQINHFDANTSSSNWEIFRRNVFNSFNALNFAIFLALIAVRAWSNIFFFIVIVSNAFSGIITELRARNMIDKLNLINISNIKVLRDNQIIEISPEDIVLDDVLLLSAGEQIPSDAMVIDGSAEVNESMLTGESDHILKKENSELLSGSYIVSGQVYARVIRVGKDNYANKIMLEVKPHKAIVSKILQSMNRISKFTGKIIIPFGLALFFEAYILKNIPLKDSVVTSSTALLGMLPKGIALLTTTSLLLAVIKLGRKNVLVQEMYSVETLARVDVVCLDKTGTITKGKMTVQDIKLLSKRHSKEEIDMLISTYINYSTDNNATAQAIRRKYIEIKDNYECLDHIPFSSDRKWGAVEIKNIGTLYLGAPEMLLKENTQDIKEAQLRGSRVLILGLGHNEINKDMPKITDDLEILAIIEISDPIREDASEILEYLRSQDVILKIISGDNPLTVSHIAKEAGFKDYENYIDCSKVDDEELLKLTETTSIFGRVSPHQKKLLVQTLKKNGHTTAMTGDGVNDILALREADCSIAMAEGDPATKQIANLVLLNSEFSDIPEILFEGRRVVNNIAHIAPIFLIKAIYSFILGLICIATIFIGKSEYLLIFPFIQVQMTLIGQFVEGMPPFILTFERNIRPVEKNFLRKALFEALPSSIMIVVTVVLLYIMKINGYVSEANMQTVSYYILGSAGLMAVVRACFPLNKIRMAVMTYSIVGFFITSHFLHNIIEVEPLNEFTIKIYLILMLIFVPTFIYISNKKNRIDKKI